MKYIILLLSIFTISCKNTPKVQTEAEKQASLDSFSISTYGRTSDEQVKHMTDSIMNNAMEKSILDTTGLYKSPIKVLKSKLIKKEYSNYRDVQLTYKNVSKKTVSAIKFSWKGEDAFGDPADMGSYVAPGYGGGFSDDVLRSGRTETSIWSIASKDGKKVILAWPTEVVFTDGTKWILPGRKL